MAGLCYALGRVLVAILFVASGYQKFMSIGAFAKTIAARNVPIPLQLETWTGLPRYEVVGYAVAAIEVLCGMMVLIGFQARFAAVVLAVTTFAVVVVGNDFAPWQAALRTLGQGTVLNGLAVIGALLMIAAAGAGPWSFDRRSRV
jgi:putative oxidoreductase